MDILIKLFAGLTILYGSFVLIAALLKGFSHLGMVLAGFSFLIGGLTSFYFINWWPSIIGIILATTIGKIFGEPIYGNKPHYGFALTPEEAKNVEKVGIFIISFLKVDPIGKNLLSDQIQNWANIGFLLKYTTENEEENPLTYFVVPWFMHSIQPKIQSLPNTSLLEFKKLEQDLNYRSAKYLGEVYQISNQYKLDFEELRNNPNKLLDMVAEEDRESVSFAIFADLIIHTELRILQYLYSWWYGSDKIYN